MPTFSAPDGTQLAYQEQGEGEPLLCIPGGAMRASGYLGGLGGLPRHLRLIMLDLRGTGGSGVPADQATYRCDRQVDDVESLRAHLGLARVDLLAHSAGGDLALLYAARYPQRIRSLALITARARAVGIDFTEEHRREAASLRSAEPWFPEAYAAYEAVWAGSATDVERDAIAPFFYGRWDAVAAAHAAGEVAQTNEPAAEIYASSGAFDPAAARAAFAAWDARVPVLAGEKDSGPLPRVAAGIAELFPGAELAVQRDAVHYPWLDDPRHFARTVEEFLSRGRSGRQPGEAPENRRQGFRPAGIPADKPAGIPADGDSRCVGR
ncbi:hydrolase [Streptomyces albospinus]|uniref:Hydrolase n=1 Tax=Streptomyces albospinus TaxID=285515 RepID=A0ABQ2UQG4_9ACTN|nr:alpha/beta hydrolase [Streptomyces albospinus]GGU48632.1 hydrolase [Streptomyces albospinus]